MDIVTGTEAEIIIDKSSPLSLSLIVDKSKLMDVVEELHRKIFGV